MHVTIHTGELSMKDQKNTLKPLAPKQVFSNPLYIQCLHEIFKEFFYIVRVWVFCKIYSNPINSNTKDSIECS